MNYDAEFVGGHVSPVTNIRQSNGYLIGLAHRDDGYARAVFFDHYGNRPPGYGPDPWIAAVRPVAPTQACRAYPIPILAKEKVL